MANRHRMGDVAHASHLPASDVPPAQQFSGLWLPAPAVHGPLGPMPHGQAFRTFPKRHGAEPLTRFCEALRAARRRRGFSQSDLAARSGIHRTHISLIESGTRECRLSTLWTLAAALHITPGDLLPVLAPAISPPALPSTPPPLPPPSHA